ncbi:uncharacterized protein LOC125044159 [Penaeus chinensis]|uniref:uncharacterized protein LOC125044159 n=1 Tax=Penaeus chinensis TaxID=139456 RepID=UPI001FB75C1D|nr:uncharacterized protein LOC125044159 [Penaeus chinensis]
MSADSTASALLFETPSYPPLRRPPQARLDPSLSASPPAIILSAYAPTLCSTSEVKDQFYEELEAKIRQIPTKEQLFLLGDFNTRVGADHDSWPRCIGRFDIGKLNENVQRLLELCSFHDFCLTNTFFPTKPHHRVSLRHPRSHHWHQLDFLITRRSLLNQKPRPRINTARTAKPELRERFARAIDEALENCPAGSASRRWNHIHEAMYQTTLDTFGRRERKTLCAARKDAQRIARCCANDYWLNLCQDIKHAADLGNVRRMYEGIKKASGPSTIKTAPLKSAEALENTPPLPVMDELDVPPTIEELKKANGSLASGKGPGSDTIPPEDVKAAKESSLLGHLHELLLQLQHLADRVYPEAQRAFRAARSTNDMVFSMRQLQKCREQRQPLYLAFIDLTKAFDFDMCGTVQFDRSCSEPFQIRNVVKQGCVLAPTLFGIFFSLLLSYAFRKSDDGIFIHTRSDGGLFNLARLRAKTKVKRVLIRELLLADDVGVAALRQHCSDSLAVFQLLAQSLASPLV